MSLFYDWPLKLFPRVQIVLQILYNPVLWFTPCCYIWGQTKLKGQPQPPPAPLFRFAAYEKTLVVSCKICINLKVLFLTFRLCVAQISKFWVWLNSTQEFISALQQTLLEIFKLVLNSESSRKVKFLEIVPFQKFLWQLKKFLFIIVPL